MAKYVGYKRPKDTKKTMKHFLTYLGHYKWAFFLVAIIHMVCICRKFFQHIICMWMVFWSDRWEIRTRIIMWNGLRTECLPSGPILH